MNIADRFEALLRAIWAEVDDFHRISEPFRDDSILTWFVRILEFSDSYARCFSAQIGTPLPLLARALFEATVDLRLMVHDPSHHRFLFEHAKRNQTQLLRAALERSKTPIAELLAIHQLSELEDVLTPTNDAKGAPSKLTLYRKCQILGIGNEYESAYRILSLETHNDALTVAEKHLKFDGDEPEIVAVREFKPVDHVYSAGLVADLTIGTTRRVWEHFGRESAQLRIAQDRHAELLKDLDALFVQFRKAPNSAQKI